MEEKTLTKLIRTIATKFQKQKKSPLEWQGAADRLSEGSLVRDGRIRRGKRSIWMKADNVWDSLIQVETPMPVNSRIVMRI